jgi:hypothetical protein
VKTCTLAHLSNEQLTRDLTAVVIRDRRITAAVLAHIAEFDARRLYLAAGYKSMHAYCVGALHFSDSAADKRINAARTAREFPEIFQAVADGRLHLTAVLVLGSRLTLGNARELIQEAEHKTRVQIEELLAARFPRTESLPMVLAMPAQLAPERVGERRDAPGPSAAEAPARRELAPERVGPRWKVEPIAKQRFLLNVMIDQETRDLLQRAQDLMSHQVSAGDVAEALKRSLKLAVATLKKRKFAATSRPRPSVGSTHARYIPSDVRRAVHERDGGQCTYVSTSGHRCESRAQLEYDHVVEVARGGLATIDNIRLRCRAHNQHTAERMFGAEFMARKRREGVARRIARRRVSWANSLQSE